MAASSAETRWGRLVEASQRTPMAPSRSCAQKIQYEGRVRENKREEKDGEMIEKIIKKFIHEIKYM